MPEDGSPVEVINGIPVVTAPDEIDVTNAARLRAALLEAGASGYPVVVVDMSQTQFCDSAGLNVLVRAHQRARATGGEVRLVVATTDVRRIFTVTGIDRVIPSYTSLDKALEPTPAAAVHPPAAS